MAKNRPRFTDEFFDYSPYFHDGAIVALKQAADSCLFEMEGAEMHICENRYLFPLSERNTLYGLLHMQGVRKILCNSQVVKNLEKEGDFFGINTLDISATSLRVTGEWVILSTGNHQRTPFCIEIEAEGIYWENTADDQDPDLLGAYLGLPKTENYVVPHWYRKKFGIDIPVEKLTKEIDVDLHTWLHRRKRFRNVQTGQVLDYDKGQFGLEGHAGTDHYHRLNPECTTRHNECLDYQGNPCGRYKDRSHLYPPSGVTW